MSRPSRCRLRAGRCKGASGLNDEISQDAHTKSFAKASAIWLSIKRKNYYRLALSRHQMGLWKDGGVRALGMGDVSLSQDPHGAAHALASAKAPQG